MPSKVAVGVLDEMMRDMFPLDGEPVKPWVTGVRDERAELERNGKRVAVEPHDDNTGAPCREVGPATLVHGLLHHDCCNICNEQGEKVSI